MSELLIYGGYGYSGRRIAAACLERGLKPILAGRNHDKIKNIAEKFSLPARCFALDDAEGLKRGLAGVSVVLHCAGPFSATAAPMLAACLEHRVHYLDITGEYLAIEAVAARDDDLKAANILAMCGVGMDVAPTDCLAMHLKNKMPNAVCLEFYIHALQQVSRGTALSMVESLGRPNIVRENGVLVPKPAGADRRRVKILDRTVAMVGLPWGDISTAWRTTGIPNIAVWMTAPPGAATTMAALARFPKLLQSLTAQRVIKKLVSNLPDGPGEDKFGKGKCEFLAVAIDGDGRRAQTYLSTIDGYALTARSASAIAARILQGEWVRGFQTPGGLFGPDFALDDLGAERRDLAA